MYLITRFSKHLLLIFDLNDVKILRSIVKVSTAPGASPILYTTEVIVKIQADVGKSSNKNYKKTSIC